jgi:hypothetical protein
MFIEFETPSGRTMLNVRHIMQVKPSGSLTEIIFANGGSVNVKQTYEDVCDQIGRLVGENADRIDK